MENNDSVNVGTEHSSGQAVSSLVSPEQGLKRRSIDAVLLEMMSHVPPYNELFNALEKVRRDARYKAPEQEWESWQDGMVVLNEYLPDPSKLEAWQRRVVNIWMNKPDNSTGSRG